MRAQTGITLFSQTMRGCGVALALAWGVLASSAHAQVGVTDSGTPAMSIPIPVPPGVSGMAPKLAISYTGGTANGPLGLGWSIDGLSIITRCPSSIAIDGLAQRRTVMFRASDKLCLDGQRLIQTNDKGYAKDFPQGNDAAGPAVGAFSEFRTEKSGYSRIRAYGAANRILDPQAGADDTSSGPAYFKVWTKSGLIYEYGAVSSAVQASRNSLIGARPVIDGQPKNVATVWAVSRITDTLGNSIEFKYEQRDFTWGSGSLPTGAIPGREWNLIEIQYSGNKVVFRQDVDVNGADLRPDRAETYHMGAKYVGVRRLKTITTYINSANTDAIGPAAGAVAVTTIALSYDQGPVTGRSRITKIQQCAGDVGSVRCLPATTMSYSDGARPKLTSASTFNAELATAKLSSTDRKYGVLVGDFDGDGLSDILRWSDTSSENALWLSNGNGEFRAAPLNLTGDQLFSSNGCYASFVVDTNGDGLPDIVRIPSSKDNTGAACGLPMQADVFINQGQGSFAKRPIALEGGGAIPMDRIRSQVTSHLYCGEPVSNPVGGQSGGVVVDPTQIPQDNCRKGYGRSEGASFYFLDFDGDGIMDLVTSRIPALLAEDPWPSLTTPNPTQIDCVGCTHVYRGLPSGAFVEVPPETNKVADVSLYTDPGVGWDLQSLRKLGDVNGDGIADLMAAGSPRRPQNWVSNGDGSFTMVPATKSCDVSIDFNGDGRVDCMTLSKYEDGSGLFVADGSGSYPNTTNYNLSNAQLSSQPSPLGSNYGISVLDLNGDGRQDILRWHDNENQNLIYLSNGDGTFTLSNDYASSPVKLKSADGKFDFVAGDFTGRGATEFLRVSVDAPSTDNEENKNKLLLTADFNTPDMLVSVTSGAGSVTTLGYVSLANSASQSSGDKRYKSDRNSNLQNPPGVLDISGPFWVVSTLRSDTGLGASGVGTQLTEYSYFGLKVDTKGRGLLGFREIRRQLPAREGKQLTSFTQYLQTHPYIGVASNTTTRLGGLNDTNAQLLSTTSNVYCDRSSAPGASAAATESAPCPTTQKLQYPYLRRTTETSRDLSGNNLPRITTDYAYERTGDPSSYGDPTSIVVTTEGTAAGLSQSSVKTTTNQYRDDDTRCGPIDDCRWILGRLERASVSSTVPDSLADVTTSAGNGANAASTNGTLPINAKPNLKISGLTIGTVTANDNDTWSIQVSYTVTNTSATTLATPTWFDVAYLSADTVLDDKDQSNGSLNYRTTSLAPGASYTVNATYVTTNNTVPGSYYLIVKTDGRNASLAGRNTDAGKVAELDEKDNTQYAQVTLMMVGPDLVIDQPVAGKITSNADGSYNIPLKYTVTNTGTRNATAPWNDVVYLSADGVLDNAERASGVLNSRTRDVPVGYSYTVSKTYTTPPATTPGNYTLFVKADGRNADTGGTNTDSGGVKELSETNNAKGVAVTLPSADLAISPPILGDVTLDAYGKYTFSVTYIVTNVGGRTAVAPWNDIGYLSTDAMLDNADQSVGKLNTRATDLLPGQSYTVSTTYTAATSTPPGDYTFFVKTDGRNAANGGLNTDPGVLDERVTSNNLSSSVVSLTTGTSQGIDLKIGSVSIGTITANVTGTYSIPITYTVTNNGNVGATGSWYDIAYLSSDGVLDDSDESNGSGWLKMRTGLAPGQSYTVTATYTTNAWKAPGTYSLFIRTDGQSMAVTNKKNTEKGSVIEPFKANNLARVELRLDADVAISNVIVGKASTSGARTYTIPISYTVTNVGSSVVIGSGWYDFGYLSIDETLGSTEYSSGMLAYRSTALAPGASYTVNANLQTIANTATGQYTLFLKADGHHPSYTGGTPADLGSLNEIDEENNVASVQVDLDVDLKISNLKVGVVKANIGGTYTVPLTYTVTNVGRSASASGTWYDFVYLSTDDVLDDSDVAGTYTSRSTPLGPGESYTVTVNYTTAIGTPAGNYRIFVKTDGHSPAITGGKYTDTGSLPETDETNNVASALVSLDADLELSDVTVGAVKANTGGTYTIPVTFRVKSLGATATIAGGWNDVVYLSSDGVLDNNDPAAYQYHPAALGPGESYLVTVNFTTTNSTLAGAYTLFVKADGHNATLIGGTNTDNGSVAETNEANNVISKPIVLDADLKISNVSVGAVTAISGGVYSIPVTYTVTNIGTSSAVSGSWCDAIYLSVDGVLDDADVGRSFCRTATLAPGASYTATVTYTTKTSVAGTYTLFVKTDGHVPNETVGTNTDNGNIREADETNNIVALPVTFDADIRISGLSIGTMTRQANGSWLVPVSYTVTNASAIASIGTGWWDIAYLSSDGVLDNGDAFLAALSSHGTALAPGASVVVNANVTIGSTVLPGSYTLFVKADGRSPAFNGGTNTDNGAIAEVNEANNIASVSITVPTPASGPIQPMTGGSVRNQQAMPVASALRDLQVVAANDHAVAGRGLPLDPRRGWRGHRLAGLAAGRDLNREPVRGALAINGNVLGAAALAKTTGKAA